jgi:hypothetical protein
MGFNDNYYDSLLDDPIENQEPVNEPEPDPRDNEPLLPDQDEPDNANDNTGDDNNNDNGGDNQPEEDVITQYLKSRGIEDPTKIKFENDEGETEDRD